MPPFTLPPDYPRIRRVHSFDELLTTPLADGVNALCWERTLTGDFAEVTARLGLVADDDIAALDESRLRALSLGAAGRIAVDHMLGDLQRLRDHGLAPELNCIRAYPRDGDREVVRTDVYSFHADSAPVATATWLCTYHGAPSEGLRNDEAQRRVDLPSTRAELLRQFGGADDETFREHLAENCYDLHYAPLPQARPFSFGVGNLWRIAVDYPGSPVPPCVHRAPATAAGDSARLLLIS